MRLPVLFCLIYLPVLCLAQMQPLSRNDSALIEKFRANYEVKLAQNDLKEASRSLNETAFLYWTHNHNESAIQFYEESLVLNHKLGNENGVAMLHNNLGMLYSDMGDFEKALDHFDKTLAARRAANKSQSIISALINQAVVLNNLERYEEAAVGLEEALSISRKINDLTQMRSCYGMLSETYEKAGDVDESLKYYRLYQSFHELIQRGEIEKLETEVEEEKLLKTLAETKSKIKDEELATRQLELQNAESELSEYDSLNRALFENLTNYQLQLEVVKQKSEIDGLKAEEERNRNMATIERERSLRNLTLVAALSLVIVIFFVARNFLQVKKNQKLLSEKNEQIASQNSRLEQLNGIIQRHNERMQLELNVGREIQMGMVPTNFGLYQDKKEFDIYAMLEPAREVGGDLYDFFMIDDQHLCFCIGDVSGKGVPAALFMAVTKTLIKANAQYNKDPQTILTQVNNELSIDNEISMFVTLFLCILNLETGEMRFTNAGHNPPFIKYKSGEIELLKELHGPVLGALENISYKQGVIQLSSEDQVILFTDGVTEAMDRNSKLFSDQRLIELVKKTPFKSSKNAVETIVQSVVEYREEAAQSDDITVLSLQYERANNQDASQS